MEIIEHVDNLELFLNHVTQLSPKNGIIVLSSIQKTPLSYLTTILMAEKILRIIPEDTHDYNKFVDLS